MTHQHSLTESAQLQAASYQALRRAFRDTLGGSGLTVQEWLLLGSITGSHATVRELADRLHIAHSLTSVTIKDLAKRKLLAVAPHPVDKRSKAVSLTTLGQRRLTTVNKRLSKQFDTLLKGVSARDLATYFSVMQRITHNATRKGGE